MKQPIEPEDIRVGDLVRAEQNHNPEYAVEGRATMTTSDGTVRIGLRDIAVSSANWFLLDRPQPQPSKKAMVAADAALFGDYALKDIRRQAARRIDEAWAKEGLGGTDD